MRQEIKLERITETSSTSTISTKSYAKENDFNSLNIKKEKISMGVRSQVSSSSSDSRDPSILVIPNEVQIITLSDDDDDDVADAGDHNDVDKMPPPMVPAPKKLPTKKTRKTQKTSASVESSASETSSSQHSETTTSTLEPKKTRKAKKPKKPVLPMVEIKQEKVTEDEAVVNGDAAVAKKTKAKKSVEEKDAVDAGSKNATMESVYEDASDKIPSVSPTLSFERVSTD